MKKQIDIPVNKEKKIDKKIKSLLNELQKQTGVTDEEIINFHKILDLSDPSTDKD